MKTSNDQAEAFREHVVIRELEAREAKAIFEKYDYTIKASHLREEYNKVMQENFQLQMKMKEEMEALKQAAQNNAEILNAQEDELSQ
jgi:hypothetical protein